MIATAAYGTELAPQVQLLREIRDNTVMGTETGTFLMTGINHVYYAFSPAIADIERDSPVLREAVKLAITPLLLTLNLMALAENGSEMHVAALAALILLLNVSVYLGTPVMVLVAARRIVIRGASDQR